MLDAQTVHRLKQADQLIRAGRAKDAEPICREILARQANQPVALQMLAMILSQRGDFAGAEDMLRRALASAQTSAPAHTNLGNILMMKGDAKGAESSFRTALSLDRANAAAHYNLALALKAQNRLDESLHLLREALRLKPDQPEALGQLGATLLAAGKHSEALAPLEKSLSIKPDSFEALLNYGLVLTQMERFNEATQTLAKAGALRQNSPEAFFALGQALYRSKQFDKAIPALARACALKPDRADYHTILAGVLLESGRAAGARGELEKAIALAPNHAENHKLLGRALANLNMPEESLAAYQRAVELDPNSVEALDYLGVAYLSLGRAEEAIAMFEKAAHLAPRDVKILLDAGRAAKYKTRDWRLERIEALLEDTTLHPMRDQVQLHFAAGRAYDDLKDYDRAFDHYAKANAIKLKHYPPDEDAANKRFEAIEALFTPEFVRAREGNGSASNLPIFVVGAPRSGTTLVEQILASHPQVTGAGEVLDLNLAIETVGKQHGLELKYPELIDQLPAAALREIGDEYVRRLGFRAPDSPRVTDKLPGNLNYVGLIHLALPNAKIVYCRRNPLDICVSTYTNLFSEQLSYTSDLGALGRRYRRFYHLMKHWERVLPKGSFLEVVYEDLVADLEGGTRRLIDFVGLPWDDRCLSFHETQRPVHTLSITQVYQPLYSTSVGRWRNYEKHVGPLIDALGDLAET
jgi:tetratricopeptide (TPR) repeat protein